MREPQVDTFCRCVKKVKKTLKAEGRAIAICTKSVLQTRGRTLRKVRCRDHLLETQPMKAGRRTRAKRREVQEAKEEVAEINRTRVVYVKNADVKTPEGTERIIGMPVGQSDALMEICNVGGEGTIEQNYLTRVPHADALVLFFGKKHQVDILRAKHPHGHLPINKAKGFAIIDFEGEHDLELYVLCAHESTRGQGVGKDMLKFVEGMAELNGKSRVVLDAIPAAVPFYQKQGYVNTHKNYYAKDVKPQEGGVFRWAGADTPVFDETKGEDWNGFPIPADESKAGKWLDDRIALWQPVVRMVSSGDGEIPIHRALKNMFNEKTDPPFDDFVKMHINLWTGDGIYRVDYDKTRAKVATQPNDGKLAKLEAINARFTRAAGDKQLKWYGLITRRQLVDVADMLIIPRIRALCTILRVLLHIDGRVVHFDLHARNMASMQDDTPVIHDVGRMRFRDIVDPYAPWEIIRPTKNNKRILRNVLMPIFQWPNYNMEYRQYFYIARCFKGLRKSWGETFKPPVAPDFKYVDVVPPDASILKFDEWLNASSEPTGDNILPGRLRRVGWIKAIAAKGEETMDVYDDKGTVVDLKSIEGGFIYLDPPYETRYHQIARVFDILSVLAALSNTSGEGTMAYFYARKTAVKILGLITANPPAATKTNVGATIRAYLETTGTQTQFEGNNSEKEIAHATAYLRDVNSARSGKTTDPRALQEANKDAYEAHKKAAQAQYDVNLMKEKANKARRVAAEAERAAEDALVAAAAARAAAPSAAAEAVEVGAPDPLNVAVIQGTEDDLYASPPTAEREALEKAEEAVVDAAEIVRELAGEDNSKELIEHGLILSVDDVIAEAEVGAPPPPTPEEVGANSPPKIKRLKNPIVFEDGEKEGKEDAAVLAEPLTGVTYVNGSDGQVKEVGSPPEGSAPAPGLPAAPKAGRRTPRRRGLPQLW
jgi:ribosomal protein S18 acetylase RimI-like enzyme